MDTLFPVYDAKYEAEQDHRLYTYRLRCQHCDDTYRPDEENRCDLCGMIYCMDCDRRHARIEHPVAQ